MRISDWSSDVCSSDLLSQIAVRQIAAEHRRDIDECGIGAVDQVRLGVGKQPVLRQVEDQQRPHAVIGKTLPHLGEEEHVKALGVAGELWLLAAGDQRADAQEYAQDDQRRDREPIPFIPQSHVFHANASTCRRIWCSRMPFAARSEEHTSELQELMRITYAVFRWKKK